MLVGVKEFRLNRNTPEVIGNTWVETTSIYLVRDIQSEKGVFYRIFLNQGIQVITDAEGFEYIMGK